MKHKIIVALVSVLLSSAALGQTTASNGLRLDSNRYVMANFASSGGLFSLLSSFGFPLDSSGNLLVDCATGCAPGVLSAQAGNTDTIACPNNTTANFATTYTIPANYLTTNRLLRVTLGFSMTTSASPPTMAFRLALGGSSVFIANPTAATGNLTSVAFSYGFLVQGTAAAGASVNVYTNPSISPGSSNVFAPFNLNTATQPVALATNGALVIQPILFCGVNTAGNSLTLQQFIVEGLN